MRGVVWIRTVLGSLVLLSSFAVAAVSDPQQMVRETGDKVLAEVTARKAELEASPELIYPLVESTVLPHFDFRDMSQSALGRFWRDASEDQKAGLTREFRELLFGSKPLPSKVAQITSETLLIDSPPPSWRELFYANRLLLGVAFALFVIAIVVSM